MICFFNKTSLISAWYVENSTQLLNATFVLLSAVTAISAVTKISASE